VPSTSWQTFDFVFVATGTNFGIKSTATSTGFAGFDYIQVTESVLTDGDMEVTGSDVVVDGDMEAVGTTAWTAVSATLTKETTTPQEGSQWLKVAGAGAGSSYARQDAITIGNTYTFSGYAKGDGTNVPSIRDGSTSLWVGTNSTSWQYFSVTFIATGDYIRLQANLSVAGHCGFDNVEITDETEATAAWSHLGTGTVSKDTTTPYEGSQCLKIKVNGTFSDYVHQDILTIGRTYRIKGRFAGDGSVAYGRVYNDVTTLVSSTNSASWQSFDVVFVATHARIRLMTRDTSNNSYSRWDAIELIDETDTCAAYTSHNSAILSKETTTPQEGSQYLRVTYNAVSNPYARQVLFTLSNTYRIRGYARGDGTYSAAIGYGGSIAWTSTTSTSWQAFDVVVVPTAATDLRLYSLATGTGYAEFDAVEVIDETEATVAWLPINSPIATKETDSPYEGSQWLKLAYNGTANPYVYQSIATAGVTYRVVGVAKGDGTFAPSIEQGATVLWVGTSSTSWQTFDITWVAAGSNVVRFKGNMSASGFVGFDAIEVIDETEACAAWTSGLNAILSKGSTSPYEGQQVLRVEYGGSNNPYAYQSILTIGKTYRIRGRARSDGTFSPAVGNYVVGIWSGNTSTSWQTFEEVFVAQDAIINFNCYATAAGYCEFDAIEVIDETDSVAAWTAGSSAILSKETTGAYEKSQWMKITYNGTSNPYAQQIITTIGKTYRVKGYFRGDGTYKPFVWWDTGTSRIDGTSSTSWQSFEEVFVATRTDIRFYSDATAAGYVGFDAVEVIDESDSVAAWTSVGSAVLSKETNSPQEGSQWLKVSGPTINTGAIQDILTINKTYRVKGYFRGDGASSYANIISGSQALAASTTSTSWQYFEKVFKADAIRIQFLSFTGGGYAGFDAVEVIDETDSVAAWSAGLGATLSKETTTPYEGSQVLRVFDSTGSGRAIQTILTIGKTYRIKGVARGDGSARPTIDDSSGGSLIWEGTSSTSWQTFDEVFVAAGTEIWLYRWGSSGSYVDFDAIEVIDETEATDAYTAGGSAILSKDLTNPYEGLQTLKIYNSTSYGSADQSILTAGKSYRVKGVARSDGTSIPSISADGVTSAFVGTNSTSWQTFDFILNPTGSTFKLEKQNSLGNYVEFDGIEVLELAGYKDVIVNIADTGLKGREDEVFLYQILKDDILLGYNTVDEWVYYNLDTPSWVVDATTYAKWKSEVIIENELKDWEGVQPDGTINGRKVVIYKLDSTTENYDTSAVDPIDGSSGAVVPVKPAYIEKIDDPTDAYYGQWRFVYVEGAVPDCDPDDNNNNVGGYWLAATRLITFKAHCESPYYNRIIYSNEITVRLSLPDYLLGEYTNSYLEKVPFGWKLPTDTDNVAAGLDGVTFITVNPHSGPYKIVDLVSGGTSEDWADAPFKSLGFQMYVN
jgi:hypothetical protein